MQYGDLVSVIIPVFNVKPYLVEALDSIVCQTYENLEIIIIDDGSFDGSKEICKSYANNDNRIIFVHQNNKGLSNARNKGLDLMSGEAVVFLDSDDAFSHAYVSKMVTAMVEEKSDLVICKFTTHRTRKRMTTDLRDVKKPSIIPGKYDNGSALRALVDGSINHAVWNKIYDKKLWESIRFPEGHVYEDVDTMYRIINLCDSIYVLNETIYMYRKRSGSITELHSTKSFNDRILSFAHLYSFAQANTPNIFNTKHLDKLNSLLFRDMIYDFVEISKLTHLQNKESILLMREKIIECGEDTDISKCELTIRVFYCLIYLCPYFFKIIHLMFHPTQYFAISFRGNDN